MVSSWNLMAIELVLETYPVHNIDPAGEIHSDANRLNLVVVEALDV